MEPLVDIGHVAHGGSQVGGGESVAGASGNPEQETLIGARRGREAVLEERQVELMEQGGFDPREVGELNVPGRGRFRAGPLAAGDSFQGILGHGRVAE